jgi:hypothetical protein
LTDIEARYAENEDPATVMDTLPDGGRFTLKEVAFITSRASKAAGRLYETDEFWVLEKPENETCNLICCCIPAATRQFKELWAFQTVDAAVLNPKRTDDNVIESEPNPEPDTNIHVDPLVGTFQPCKSNACRSNVYAEEVDDCKRVNETVNAKPCPTPAFDLKLIAESDTQMLR